MPWKEQSVMDQKIKFIMQSFTNECQFRELCRKFGISPKTGYKWKKRFLEEGIPGLKDQPPIPKSSPTKISEETICEIIRIKKAKPSWGPKKIRVVYANNHPNEQIPHRTTFERILKKTGFIEKRKIKRRFHSERIQNRITPGKPNDLWTVDFKGWWYTPQKERCEPLTVRDEFSKYILSIKILNKADIISAKQEFTNLFRTYGLPKMIRSDNGPPFASSNAIFGLTRLAVWWLSLGIQLDRIDPGSPYQNGAHERFHLDIKKELEHKINGSLKLHQSVFDVWKKEFNHERPHEAINMKTPAEVYSKSEISYYEDYDPIEYPAKYMSRQVTDRGYIRYKGRRIFISNVFTGYNVGLLKNDTGMEVWFDKNLLGLIDLDIFVFNSILKE